MGAQGRNKRITSVDLLMMDVGAIMERLTICAAVLAVRPEGRKYGYHIIVLRNRLLLFYLDDHTVPDFTERQRAFEERVLPALVDAFGQRARPHVHLGMYLGFEVKA